MELTDIVVRPDFTGLPPNLEVGLTHLTDNAAAVLIMVSGLGIVVSLIGLLLSGWTSNPHLADRFKSSLAVSIGAIALLYLGVAAANYSARLFQ
ncbi:MAG TPA: hypothetical protein VMU49_00650 [Candidatus Acidoferrales bacterium]|nr:hypothetical protein [Candidatus Acidoferrales bacterium]